MGAIFQVFIEFVIILLQLHVLVFKSRGKEGAVLTPQPRIKPTPFALEGKVLTTGPPGRSPQINPLLLVK